MNKLLKKTLKIILPILLSGFIFYWVYRDFDFSKAEEVLLHQKKWWCMLLYLFFGVMSHVLRGWRWKQTLEPLDAHPKTSDCVDAIFVSYATNLVLPRVGEVSRCGVLAKYDNVSLAKSLGTVVTERLVDTLCILLITGITFLVHMPVFFRFFEETGTKIPSLVHLVTSPWFYVAFFSIIGVLVLFYFLLLIMLILTLHIHSDSVSAISTNLHTFLLIHALLPSEVPFLLWTHRSSMLQYRLHGAV